VLDRFSCYVCILELEIFVEFIIGRYYQAVQECMERSERDWRACQSEVRAFRNCYKHSEFVKAREAQTAKPAQSASSE
jgi:hypothetical protein